MERAWVANSFKNLGHKEEGGKIQALTESLSLNQGLDFLAKPRVVIEVVQIFT